jgi:hypothetical protein
LQGLSWYGCKASPMTKAATEKILKAARAYKRAVQHYRDMGHPSSCSPPREWDDEERGLRSKKVGEARKKLEDVVMELL